MTASASCAFPGAPVLGVATTADGKQVKGDLDPLGGFHPLAVLDPGVPSHAHACMLLDSEERDIPW